ncbi:MAG: (d)CMP kinase [Phycisphaeraceae bacterium]
MQPLIITLDGPAGSGKSTVAQELARRLGLEFLNTGDMYRGITAQCLDDAIDPRTSPQAVEDFARDCNIRFDWKADPPKLYVNNRDVTARLRDGDVERSVSIVAAITGVRRVLVREQQKIGREHPRLVTEGRDQGSIVFPGAQMKFFITASAQVRARRRAEQLRTKGRDADERIILQQITERDQRDSSHGEGLIRPNDAIDIDTSEMNLPQVLDLLEKAVHRRIDRGAVAGTQASGAAR